MRTAYFSRSVRGFWVALLALLLGGLPACAQAPKNLQIYILMGQSNMVGQDPSTLAAQVDNPRILALGADNQWVVAREPMYVGGIGVGPGISFAQAMLQADPTATIGLVPCAVSGTALNQWVRGAKPYNAMLARARAAAPSGTIRGVLWHQGEADSIYQEYASTYETRLTAMFEGLREDLGLPRVPIVVGQLGDFVSTLDHPWVYTVRGALAAMPSNLTRVGFASSQGLTDKGDRLHFNASSEGELGDRFAAEMQRLEKAPTLEDTMVTLGLGQSVSGVWLAGHDENKDKLSYAVTTGKLPTGVTLNRDGSFAGVPAATTSDAGVVVKVTVSDASGASGTALVTVVVRNFNLIVSTGGDSVPGSATDLDGQTSLREAITYANAHTGADVITFDPERFSTPKTVLLASALPKLAGDVTIAGPGAKLLTITVATRSTLNLLYVTELATASLDGLSLSNGLVGISNSGFVKVSNCTFRGNDAAIRSSAVLSAVGCTFVGGKTGLYNAGTLSAINCTVTGQSVAGIANMGLATVTNCTLIGNELGVSNTGRLLLGNSLVLGNAGANISGALSNLGHNVTAGTAAAAGLDPLGLQDNGGPTPTFAIMTNGAALNKGDNWLVPGGIASDQRGTGYNRIQSRTVDIGAYEFRPNKAPTNVTLSRDWIAEMSGPDAGVGTLAATDPDLGDSRTFSLPEGADDNDFFSIVNGVQLHARESFDAKVRSSYFVTIRVTDWAGLCFEKRFEITVTRETTKPIVRVMSPFAGQRLYLQNMIGDVIRGAAQDNVGVTGVKVKLWRLRDGVDAFWNGSNFVAKESTVSAAVSGTTDATWVLSDHLPPMAKLDAGVYQLSVTANDAAGNQSSAVTRSFTLKNDNTPPTIALAAPTVNQKMLLSSFLTGGTWGTAADAEGVTAVKVRLYRKENGRNVYWDGTEFIPTSAYVSADLTGSTGATWKFRSQLPPVALLPPGPYSVSAYALDGAGNKSATVTVSFTLGTDFISPTVSILAPTMSQVVKIDGLGADSMTGRASDNLGVSSVKLKLQRQRGATTTYWNGTDFTTTPAWVKASLTPGVGNTITWRLENGIPVEKLDKGGYTLYATASDAAGNDTATVCQFAVTVAGGVAVSAGGA